MKMPCWRGVEWKIVEVGGKKRQNEEEKEESKRTRLGNIEVRRLEWLVDEWVNEGQEKRGRRRKKGEGLRRNGRSRRGEE